MIKQYRKVIKHEIEIDESILAKLIDHAKQELQDEDAPSDVEDIFEEVFFYSNEEIKIYIDGNPRSVREVEMFHSDDVYDFVYDMIYDFVAEYCKKGE